MIGLGLLGVIIIVVLVLLLWCVCRWYKHDGETYYQKVAKKAYIEVNNEQLDEKATEAIDSLEAIPEKDPIDHFRLGVVQLLNAKNPKRAHKEFKSALKQINDKTKKIKYGGKRDVYDDKNIPYVMDRINEFKDQFIDIDELEELPVQDVILNYYNQRLEDSKKVDVKKKEKAILEKKHFNSDAQNVHDSLIYDTLEKQYDTVKYANISNLNDKTSYRDIVNFLKQKYHGDHDKTQKINQVIETLNKNIHITSLPDTTFEQDVLITVWKRANDPKNANSSVDIKNAVCDSLLDCAQDGWVVCPQGRVSRVWNSLAHLDYDPNIGVLKSKQIVRNEILDKCAKIVKDGMDSMSEEVKESYDKGEVSEAVMAKVQTIKTDLDKLKTDYAGTISEVELSTLVEESKAVV